MILSLRPLVLCLLPLLLLAGACSRNDRSTVAEKPAVAVETTIAAPAPLVDTIEVTGTLTAQKKAELKSEIGGLYREIYVTEWAEVRRGQPLARIQASETETNIKRGEAAIASARAALLQAQVEAERSRRESERMAKLKSAGLATQQQLDDSGSAAGAAAAQVAAAQARLEVSEEEVAQLRIRLEKSVVRAPIDGVVALRTINVGDLSGVDAGGKVIFRIVDNRLLDLVVTVPSRALAAVAVGQALDFTADGRPETFHGTLKHLNPSVSTTDRSLQIMAEIDNRDGRLRDGLFVKGAIVTGRRENLLLVPRTILSGVDLVAKKAALFVVVNAKAERRSVVLGELRGEQVEIVSGLKGGESYVSRGVFNLRDGDRVVVSPAKL